jgi:hypothetical protein
VACGFCTPSHNSQHLRDHWGNSRARPGGPTRLSRPQANILCSETAETEKQRLGAVFDSQVLRHSRNSQPVPDVVDRGSEISLGNESTNDERIGEDPGPEKEKQTPEICINRGSAIPVTKVSSHLHARRTIERTNQSTPLPRTLGFHFERTSLSSSLQPYGSLACTHFPDLDLCYPRSVMELKVGISFYDGML